MEDLKFQEQAGLRSETLPKKKREKRKEGGGGREGERGGGREERENIKSLKVGRNSANA